MASGRTVWVAAAGVTALALLAAGGVFVAGREGLGPFGGPATPTPTPGVSTGPSPQPAGPVLVPVDDAAPQPTDAGLAATLDPLLRDPALGPEVVAAVTDGETGEVLWGQRDQEATAAASTVKLLTTAAALQVLGPGHRLTTTTVAGGPAEVWLVGGGDPTLTPARLTLLATRTAGARRAAGLTGPVRLRYDVSLFTGPAVSPAWPPEYVASGVVAPVVALSVDAGRLRPDEPAREADPALAAATRFAAALAAAGQPVTGPPVKGTLPPAPTVTATPAGGSGPTATATATPGPADPPSGTRLAAVTSAPLADLVEQALTDSDNDLAEALARHVALGTGRPGSFEGGAAAVLATVAGLGLDTAGAQLFDGSGLARSDLVPPRLLARLLAASGATTRPALRPVLTGLPVAGVTGTLADRFDGPADEAGAGVVRAKTGTLTGIAALAGSVVDTQGRWLTFAVQADRVPAVGTDAARAALDRVATALAGCGCGSAPVR